MAGPAEPAAVVHVLGCAVDRRCESCDSSSAVAGGCYTVIFRWEELIVGEGIEVVACCHCWWYVSKILNPKVYLIALWGGIHSSRALIHILW